MSALRPGWRAADSGRRQIVVRSSMVLNASLSAGRRTRPPVRTSSSSRSAETYGRDCAVAAGRLRAGGAGAPRGSSGAIGLRDHIEERPQLVDVAERRQAPPRGHTLSARVTRRSTTHFCSVCESRNRWVFPSSVVSIQSGVGVPDRTSRLALGNRRRVPPSPRPTTNVWPHVVHWTDAPPSVRSRHRARIRSDSDRSERPFNRDPTGGTTPPQ